MPVTPGILTALEAGFWPRLMGLLAVRPLATAEQVAALALRSPTSLRLASDEAAELLRLGTVASGTAARWASGADIISAILPHVPVPDVPIVGRGGNPGSDGGAVVVVGGRLVTPTGSEHVTFGTGGGTLPRIGDIQAALETYAEEVGSDSPGLAEFIEDLGGQVELEEDSGAAVTLIPDWVVRRLAE